MGPWHKHTTPRCPVAGEVHFKGDLPYRGSTLQLLTKYPDADLNELIKLKTVSFREGIGEYLPFATFDEWIGTFVHTLRWPRHAEAVHTSLEYSLPFQLNRSPPGWSAPLSLIRTFIDKKPDKQKGSNEHNEVLRYLLSISENLRQAAQFPDLVLTMAIYQAAHRTFLERTQETMLSAHKAGHLTDTQIARATQVLDDQLNQFREFIVFSTYLPLTLLKHTDIIEEAGTPPTDAQPHVRYAQTPLALKFTHPPGYQDTVGQAMDLAGKIMLSKMFVTDFGNTMAMVCPARPHVQQSIKGGMFQRLHGHILANADKPVMQRLLYRAHRAILYATPPGSLYYRFRGINAGGDYLSKELAEAMALRGANRVA